MYAFLLLLGCGVPQRYEIVDLGALGGSLSIGYGISETGHAAGTAQLASGAAHPAWFDGARWVDLGLLPGGSGGEARAANPSGAVAGWTVFSGGTRACRWEHGGVTDLGLLPNGTHSYGFAINARGEVAGYGNAPPFGFHAFAARGTTLQDLGTLPGGSNSFAYAINGRGEVAGASEFGQGGLLRAFLWRAGVMHDLGAFQQGSGASAALDLNDLGEACGWSTLPNAQPRAAFWTGALLLDLGVLTGGLNSLALGLNDVGQAVGRSYDAAGRLRAVLYENGAVVDLNGLAVNGAGWELWEARDINDAGDIVGNGSYLGQTRGYWLRPLGLRLRGPEPGRAGARNTAALTGAAPQARLYLLSGFQGGFTTWPNCPAVVLGILNPSVAAAASAGPAGNAWLEHAVPAALRGGTVYLQAVVPAACAASNLVVHTFP